MPQSRPRIAPPGGPEPNSCTRQSLPPTDIGYYLQGIDAAADPPPEADAILRQAEMWKGLAFIALFVAALALIVSLATSVLLAS